MTASAADTSGYKALVCVFLKGGMDGADTILPADRESHDALAVHRGDLFRAYGVGSGSSSRDPENVLRLDTARDFGGQRFGLPRELEGLHGLYTSGRLAVVGNVGPLIEPTTRSGMESRSARVPERLFSHNDQQSQWMSMGLEGRRLGWGGQFADRVAPTSGSGRTFTSITASRPDSFLNAIQTRQYPARAKGSVTLRTLTDVYRLGRDNDEARAIMANHFASGGYASDNLLMRDLAAGNGRTQADNATFDAAVQGAPAFTTVFPDTKLGKQLETIARVISIRGALCVSRQLLYASMGGFDTHANQSSEIPARHREIGPALKAFSDAMDELGTSESVTLFTASDFGRTVTINGSGTDHGWGNHHLVMGGAVKGGEIYGDIPAYDFSLESYAKTRGRLIPGISVDQYAGTLGRWFGLADDEMSDALPNLGNFSTKDLGFMRPASS